MNLKKVTNLRLKISSWKANSRSVHQAILYFMEPEALS